MNACCRFGVLLVLLAVPGYVTVPVAFAEVTTIGDVDPIPPTDGGSMGGTLKIGEGNSSEDILYGSMTVDGGTVLENRDGILGDHYGAIGEVFMDGDGSEWNLSDELTVGNEGMAELNITHRARIHVDNDMYLGFEASGYGRTIMDGLTTVLEVGDDWNVGYHGFGDFHVRHSARLITRDAWIGRNSGSNGYVTLQDQGTLWHNSHDVVVSGYGNATLEILDGALLQNQAATIGQSEASYGRAIVGGPQTRWIGATLLTVGDAGYGGLHIRDQARVEFDDIVVGGASTGNGLGIVEGEGTLWHSRDSLVVGDVGLGAIEIRDSGMMRVIGATTVGPRGRIELDGGYLTSSTVANHGVILGTAGQIVGSIVNGPSGEVRTGRGDYLLISGPVTNSGRLESIGGEMEFDEPVTNMEAEGQIVAQDAIFRFRGSLENAGMLAASFGTSNLFGEVDNTATGTILIAGDSGVTFYDEVTNDGALVVLPGATAVFVDDLTMTSRSSLVADIAGYGRDIISPQIEVGGMAALAGLLQVNFDSAFQPDEGDEFGLMVADGGILGIFDATDLPMLETGLSWELDYSSHQVTLRVLASSTPQGDLDGDGDIDGDDLQIWRTGFGVDLTGDADRDGDTDGNDFLVWQSGFGSNGSAMVAAVPEPASAGMVLAATLLWIASACIMRRTPFFRLHFRL